MIKLNLGAGTSRYQDFISVDLHTDADVTHDLTTPLPYPDNSVDQIYSSHVVEHFTRTEWEAVRKDWSRVIRPGGTIEIRTPDIAFVARNLYDAHHNRDTVEYELYLTRMYGDQGHPGGFHKNGFTEDTLIASFPEMTAELLDPSTDYELHMRFTK